ncbi:SAM-dependent methyltransferase [Saccharopolyspora rhizosphaerae]|uniref:SAM-dependent methyltransferase n=1 Tax=Saccharopolyspora rhizosphaerae TaxID=2492662 RepID=A0A426JY13_9PSEU|nr:SAM-dependent methyltransferase [Saccharopolyspora rhizosphaerae]RRO18002.1 SAM-dependent methyltransferase [Saccharopolyspora rhizosphaerae]
MNQHGGRLPAEIDTSVAHEARVYDYWLGGKDNFAADRALGDAIAEHVPTIKTMARANRAFVGRVVRFLVQECGIRQFLDVGTGIPTSGNVHEVAQRAEPSCRVVYVDNDPIVLAHARALMTSTDEGETKFIYADLHDPDSILSDPSLAGTLDLTQPTAVMLVAVLMYFRENAEVEQVLGKLLDAVPSGSYLAITHPTADFDPEAMAGVVASAERSGIPFQPRSQDEVASFFQGMDLVEPGVAPVLAWRPDDEPGGVTKLHPEHQVDPHSAYYWAAVGRKR